jgi:phage tail tape-measure protein
LEDNMKRLAISAVAAASLSLSGCATTAAQNHRTGTAVAGAGIGGAAGAIAGSVLPGIGTAAGAMAGATLGGIVGNVIGGRQYYRDTRGYCYYVDQQGRPVYNRNVKC